MPSRHRENTISSQHKKEEGRRRRRRRRVVCHNYKLYPWGGSLFSFISPPLPSRKILKKHVIFARGYHRHHTLSARSLFVHVHPLLKGRSVGTCWRTSFNLMHVCDEDKEKLQSNYCHNHVPESDIYNSPMLQSFMYFGSMVCLTFYAIMQRRNWWYGTSNSSLMLYLGIVTRPSSILFPNLLIFFLSLV